MGGSSRPTQGGGSIRHHSPGGGTFQGGGGGAGAAVGVVTEVFKVFLRLVEQIIEAWVVHEEEIFKVFSQDMEQNLQTPRVSLVKSDVGLVVPLSGVLEAFEKITHFLRARAVLTGDSGHYFYELHVLAVTAPCVLALALIALENLDIISI